MKKILIPLFAFIALNVKAQIAEVTIKGNIGFPQSEFRENYDKEIYGLGAQAMFNIKEEAIIEYGFGINYSKMDMVKGEIPVIVNNHSTRGQLEVNSKELNTELNGRLIPYHGIVQPFVELNAGANTYFTNSKIETEIGYYNEDEQLVNKSVSTTKSGMVDGLNFYLGWTAGTKVKLSKNFLLTATLNRTYTSESRYMDANSVEISSKGNVDYNLSQSSTSQLKTSIGITYRF